MLGYLNIALPTLIGIFWGAPLLGRDCERGTDRLVLTQDANRVRRFILQLHPRRSMHGDALNRDVAALRLVVGVDTLLAERLRRHPGLV
jgi:hypothetical protein